MSERYIGLMSGTSLDGVDGVLADFSDPGFRVVAHSSQIMPVALRAELLALNRPGENELHRAALAAQALVRLYHQVVVDLLHRSGIRADEVRAIGAHGQTVRHRPILDDGIGYTLQLNNPALLAEWCGIDVIADFRSRDVAAGGQGAPLVPAFHHSVFRQARSGTAVLNLGGIANLTVLGPAGQPADSVLGFDCGPANALIDHWCQQHRGQNFDRDGAWAAGGQVREDLLATLLDEPFFALSPPKSTGRDLFNADWLDQRLERHPGIDPQDVQATLTALTVRSCAEAVRRHAPSVNRLVVCGGGAYNATLMAGLARGLPELQVMDTQALGLSPLQVEAAAFAWLARQTVLGQPGNLPKATGARGARVLGAVYPR
ncbi:MAG: anhydro-N-acetylmuramic acid kinase [Rhodoferax sp.]|nr:anhydro-N-acetylmuramic acid kinase [Rhodoferax sp.]